MKDNNHPKCKSVNINCICGATYNIKSTKVYKVDICSKCHPFFTGKNKLLDTEGRIEKFQNKYNYKIKY
jgi:large subunit ribosomal protein L31